MKKYYVAQEIAVDFDKRICVVDNGEYAGCDKYVGLYTAPELDEVGEETGSWLYYIKTNADPILLYEDTTHIAECIETLNINPTYVCQKIMENYGDLESAEWARDAIKEALVK